MRWNASKQPNGANTLNTKPASRTEAVLNREPFSGLLMRSRITRDVRVFPQLMSSAEVEKMEAHMTDVSQLEWCLARVARSPPVGTYTDAVKHQKRFDPKIL